MVRHHKKEKAIRLDIPERDHSKKKRRWQWRNLLPKGLVEIGMIVGAVILLVLGVVKIAVAIGAVWIGWMGVMGRVKGRR